MKRILVVEDNAVLRLLLASQLKHYGLKCEFAEDGRKGLEMLLTVEFDFCFMDIMLPHLSGIEVTKLIREHEALWNKPRLPIYALTASAFSEEIAKCKENDMDDCITKPYSLEELGEVLRRCELI